MTTAPSESAGRVPEWTLGDRLRKAREEAGLSVQGMADALYRSRNTVGNYEADRSRPTAAIVKAWALRTGVPLAWLQGGPPAGGNAVLPECARQDSNLQPSDP